jgi:hypothetical protein
MFPEIGDLEAKRKRIKPIPILQSSGQAQAVFGKVPYLRWIRINSVPDPDP